MSLHKLLARLNLPSNRRKSIKKEALAPYTYTPIDEAAGEIRLLTLHKGKPGDPIKITLLNTPFTVDNVPAFEAVSYTWGSPENPVDVFITHSRGTVRTLSVTKNLGEALPYLRYRDRDRVLWIDAICVNQQDLEERNQQVQRMAEIYSKAVRVVAWLGPSTEYTPVAIRCFKTITSNVKGNWESHTLVAVSGDGSWADPTFPLPFNDEEYLAVTEFLSSKWFERLWIYQEIRLSSADSILLCGQYNIQWESFRNALHTLYRKVHLGNIPSNPRDLMEIASHLCDYGGEISIQALLDQTKNCKCSDPRDRIFALLSLVPKSRRRFGITPDYTKSPGDVYADAFKRIAAHSMSIRILLTAEMDESTENRSTWVPDWSRPKVSFMLPQHYAAGNSRNMPQFPSKRVMQVEGTIVDSISLAEPFQASNNTRTMAQEVKRIILLLMPTTSEMEDSSLRSMCRALCAGEFSDRYAPPRETLPDIPQTVQHIREIIVAHEDAWPYLKTNILSKIEWYAKERCVCKTSKGRAVLAPKTTRPGDVVTVLLGCPNLMVLRSTQDGPFKVVGEAYCDELSYGEVLMGPVPEPFKIVLRWDENDQCYDRAFLNLETGSFQLEDPRLSQFPLPLGWRKERHRREERYQWFVNDITGEGARGDPRLTTEALRERGVDIHTLNLV
ncbi:hypothetical protein L207DRAFT_642561 [Hyaloscypha variabilis F]|uniref:Heterokaryon incompatibility domain-containing protein n=1 Tax=Hyaloscypha variabilis (strain UAMH 11265 / GT02V1 / F) TaxID=1149755 RepID=A0A2J6QSP0_HYAVF|nr:hypothetical protein L207DRAFT_642561 [Hyaloscypha variabilis F]